MKRQIIIFGIHFPDFYERQDIRTKAKIDYVLKIIRELDQIPEQYFKYLKGTDGLFEARIKLGNNIYRIICFFDRGNLVVLLNGFQKKNAKNTKKRVAISRAIKKRIL